MTVYTIVCLRPNRYTCRNVWGIPLCDYALQNLSRYTVVREVQEATLPTSGYVAVVYDDMPLVTDEVLHRLALELERRDIASIALGEGRLFKAGKQMVPPKHHCHVPELLSVKDEASFALACETLRARIVAKQLARGVVIATPSLVCLDWQVQLEEGVVVSPFVCVRGRTTVGAGSVLMPYTYLSACRVGSHAVVAGWHEGADIGDNATLGACTYTLHTGVGNACQMGAQCGAQDSLIGDGATLSMRVGLQRAILHNDVALSMGADVCEEEIQL